MLGSEVEKALRVRNLKFTATDKDVDICDVHRLFDFAKNNRPEWIVNCSAYTQVDRAEDESAIAYKINADGVKNIAQVTRELGAKLIHISTDYVFDGAKTSEYFETDNACPIGVYGQSKLSGENNITETISRYFIIRTAWLYGISGSNFVKTMLKLFKERDEVKVVNDQYGSPTYAYDLADFICTILSNDENCLDNKYGVYNFTNEGCTNWYEFACKIYELARAKGILEKEVMLIPISTADYPTKAKRPLNSYLSKEKVKKQFGFDIRSWPLALEDCLNKV